ncbi:MAG: Unknown protein [uncultured Campylobacterales bacterium]|uniref:Calcineurin-like phosphoesterase domain-containing protein n=1 Tax=uncultured Campylobacterales bacterium TaxID=352960 RepID=A0A6S6SSQ5_9BACT|nr:MAG: Unknown protein [uncultured Campylobacterales bacterium]
MQKLIVYGDIHGCYDEIKSLRENINPQENDIEVCVGDIITKGKDSIKTLRYIQEYDIKSVLGNHEDKIIRYLQHEKLKNQNPITLDEDEKNILKDLNSKDIDFLITMPLFMKFKNITILHGGLHNSYDLHNLNKKEKTKILRMRYLDKNHNFVTLGKENDDSIFWADVYDGNQGFVVYGHQRFKEARINKYTIGIDTGCVYNNKLSAIVFELKGQNFIKHSIISFDKIIK